MPDQSGQWIICNRSRFAEAQAKYDFQRIEMPSSPEPYKG